MGTKSGRKEKKKEKEKGGKVFKKDLTRPQKEAPQKSTQRKGNGDGE